nr:MAG: major capsid protein [Microvirus sp.]
MGIGNRYSQHSFAQIPDVNIGRSQFDRSFSIKDTFDFDYLIPIFVDEVLPGDTFNLTMNTFARLATQVVPVMDNMYIDYFFFFVPNRLTYNKWEQLNGAQANPDDTIDYIMPTMPFPAGGPEVDSIFDKFGLPTDVAAGYELPNTLPLRCYNRIWSDWFKDQNLQDDVVQNVDEGPDAPADYALLKRNKAHDYFTSCLPWPQKGDAIDMPLGSTAPVKGVGWTGTTGVPGATANVRESGDLVGTRNYTYSLNTGSNFWTEMTSANTTTARPTIYADLSAATAATVNQFRQAIMIQSLLELDARGGTRYVEILRAHFGVISPDFRLQRSEYLGGGKSPINVNPVAQNAPTSGSNALGQLAAYATSSATSRDNIGFTKSFVEHGYIIGLACARADITYQQGLNRMWSRSTRYDFFWPKLQQLGEQEVLTKEIYLDGTATDEEVFGYQERYAEYRYKPSEIHGRFRSQFATPLDMWHLAQEFSAAPTLNDEFIEQNTPIERAIAIDTEPDILFDCYFQLRCARPMLTYSVPATLGRF